MATITEPIKLSLGSKSTMKYVFAKQGDSNTRYIRVTLTAGMGTVSLGTGATAKIRAELPDGTTVEESATVNEDDTITAPLSKNLLAQSGVAKADIIICGSSGQRLSTETFRIKVQSAFLT